MKTFALLSGIATVSAHSWADNVAGGSYRGAQGGNDLVKQRYFCPLATLDACQPPAKNGIVLTADAMRPCRSDFPTPQMGNAVSGQPMYVHWAGNGHTGVTGTCVNIYIAPYALDPDFSSFQKIASCLPFAHGTNNDLTDASVTLPNLPSGQYTVFWEWDFAPFWFSSCSDINVASSSGSSPPATPAPAVTPAPTAGPTAAPATHGMTMPPSAPTPTVTRAPAPSSGSSGDCKKFPMPNAQCQAKYGSTSYCVSWVSDKCGRSQCVGQAADMSSC